MLAAMWFSVTFSAKSIGLLFKFHSNMCMAIFTMLNELQVSAVFGFSVRFTSFMS